MPVHPQPLGCGQSASVLPSDERKVLHAILSAPFDLPTLAELLGRPSWMDDGACRGQDPDIWHPIRGQDVRPLKATCAACPVREPCLDYALAEGIKVGIWGGMSERERRRLRRRRAVEERAA